MSEPVFADTWYWIALLNNRDQHHLVARRLNRQLTGRRIITTDEVLVEMLAYFAERGDPWRKRAVQMVRRLLLIGESVEIHAQSRQTFLTGLDLYERRPDKGYSLTDCISMQTMRSFAIQEVLTGDSHFRQEGFTLL